MKIISNEKYKISGNRWHGCIYHKKIPGKEYYYAYGHVNNYDWYFSSKHGASFLKIKGEKNDNDSSSIEDIHINQFNDQDANDCLTYPIIMYPQGYCDGGPRWGYWSCKHRSQPPFKNVVTMIEERLKNFLHNEAELMLNKP